MRRPREHREEIATNRVDHTARWQLIDYAEEAIATLMALAAAGLFVASFFVQ